MGRAFKIYRIVCTLTGKALISGSDHPVWYGGRHPSGRPLAWHQRGSWSDVGAFWKTENSVRRHLLNLCHDWINQSAPSRYPRYENQRDYWTSPVPGPADLTRLQFLRVEQIYVTSHTTTTLSASDFMGIPDQSASGGSDAAGSEGEAGAPGRTPSPSLTPKDQSHDH